MPDKPFLGLLRQALATAPHHGPKEWADGTRANSIKGGDKLREETLTRQKQLGVVPADARLTTRRAEVLAWEKNQIRPMFARQMEIYAGYLENTDYHVGRLIDALKDLQVINDTLI